MTPPLNNPEVFGSNTHEICPDCGGISMPAFSSPLVNAVLCQRPGCGTIIELKDGQYHVSKMRLESSTELTGRYRHEVLP